MRATDLPRFQRKLHDMHTEQKLKTYMAEAEQLFSL
eukprot:CAMPEP_0206462134 /NCGR_PEP_ID=MMETSP0324_2-20121206/25799_1 /ASSEMBLY_ACC=CAM_ASM_000836 /TAXON_ID=2866 /ORGANISM="Crypthecodinium cohnii, Strain Seligo" /LENGTH=35 /DNA_ID= /DNA_START= /DNA_END= /DNA_ORIENTATION=